MVGNSTPIEVRNNVWHFRGKDDFHWRQEEGGTERDLPFFTGRMSELDREPHVHVRAPSAIRFPSDHYTHDCRYWSYNSAQVEIVLFEDLPVRGYKMLYEKPYVDCGESYLLALCAFRECSRLR